MEWLIIILLVIFVIMIFTLKPAHVSYPTKMNQTQKVQCYQDTPTDLVMLPNPNPASLIMH
jgi:hypothetical protein